MRIPFFSLCLFALGCAPAAVVQTPGIGGAALTTSLSVHVEGESDGHAIAGASVDVGGAASTTDANGDATLTTASSSVVLRVSASGFVTERWIGVDRDRATVALAEPRTPRALTGTISGGAGDLVVSAMTAVSMLRITSITGSTSACAGGACDVMLDVETDAPDLALAIVDASQARLVPHVAPSSDGHFVVDASATAARADLVTLAVTVPAAPGLEGVVGVPGLALSGDVFFFPEPVPSPTSVHAPAQQGPFASGRLWYVARGTNAAGSGESVIFDRDVGADGVVDLPSAFLAIPSASAASSVGIDVDPEVDLYVVEALAGATAERALVLHPSGSHVDVPITLAGATSVTVRAIDTTVSSDGIDLVAAESAATRTATLWL